MKTALIITLLVVAIISFIINILILGAAVSDDDREKGMGAIWSLVINLFWIIASSLTLVFG